MIKRSKKLKSYFLFDINVVIRFLILSDTILLGAAGLLAPIFALYIQDFISTDHSEIVAGIAVGIYLLTKSIMQIPIAELVDRIRGERDDFWIMFIFTLIIAVIPLTYLFIHTPFQLYIVQFFLGLCTAFTFPTYMAIFTRHIDKSKEGTEWGVYFTATDLSSALLAIIGGYVASTQGFPTLITIIVGASIIGSLLLWPIKPFIRMPKR